MTRMVHLARHGTHDEVGRVLSGRSDVALNAQGLVEAEALAAWATTLSVRTIHTSPRLRTRQTAAPVASHTGLPATVAPALDEIDFGTFTGKTFAALADDPAWHRWNAERHIARCPDGETMGEAVDRALGFLVGLSEADTPALCVTHCDIIRGVVAHVLGMHFGRMFALDCDPGSLTTLAFDGAAIRVVSLNHRLI
jgi:probable phosphoglycerate mutase